MDIAQQAAISRRYGSLRKFVALGDDIGLLFARLVCKILPFLQTRLRTGQIASIVAAWETSKEYLAKEVEIRAEAKVLGRPCVLQIHDKQAMIRAIEAVHGFLSDADCPSSDYLSVIRVKRPSVVNQLLHLWTTFSATKSFRIRRFSLLLMQPAISGSRVPRQNRRCLFPGGSTGVCAENGDVRLAKHGVAVSCETWAQRTNCRAILETGGVRVGWLRAPSDSGEAPTKVKPDWVIILAYERKLCKEAMKKVAR